MANVYVLMCSVKPNLAEGVLNSIVKKAAMTILDNGGIVRNIRNNGVRRTPFPYSRLGRGEKFHQSQMFTVEMFTPGSTVKVLESALGADENVLRYTTLAARETLPRVPKLSDTI